MNDIILKIVDALLIAFCLCCAAASLVMLTLTLIATMSTVKAERDTPAFKIQNKHIQLDSFSFDERSHFTLRLLYHVNNFTMHLNLWYSCMVAALQHEAG